MLNPPTTTGSLRALLVSAAMFAASLAPLSAHAQFTTCKQDYGGGRCFTGEVYCGGKCVSKSATPAGVSPSCAISTSFSCDICNCASAPASCNASTIGATCTSASITNGGVWADSCSSSCVCPMWTKLDGTICKPFLIMSPAAAQSGNINVTGNMTTDGNLTLTDNVANSGKGDIFMSSGKAISVNGTGARVLNMGNWGGGWFDLNVFGNMTTTGDVTASNMLVSKAGWLLLEGNRSVINAGDPVYGTTKKLDVQGYNGEPFDMSVMGDLWLKGDNYGKRSDLRFYDTATPTNYIGFRAPTGIVGQTVWNLPGTDGTAGQFLKTDGAKNLSWASQTATLATLQNAYDNDANGGGVTLTTNATDGALVIAGNQALNVTTTGNTAFDSNTLVVDAANNRVGMGIATGMTTPLDVLGGADLTSAGTGGVMKLHVCSDASATSTCGYLLVDDNEIQTYLHKDNSLGTLYLQKDGGSVDINGQLAVGSIKAPLYLYGAGLDGSSLQKTAIYSDTSNGLYFDAAKDSAGNKLDVHFNWRGGGTDALFIKGSNSRLGLGTSNPAGTLHVFSGYDADETDSDGFIVLGDPAGANIGIDNNEIVARNNNVAARMYIQAGGGDTTIGGNTRIGNAFVGDVGHGSTWAGFTHKDSVSTSGYSFLANDTGKYALMNIKDAGGFMGFRVENNDVMQIGTNGDITMNGKHAFRGTDPWLRLNNDGDFTSGIHTPYLFTSNSLSIGKWTDPGDNNLHVQGTATFGVRDNNVNNYFVQINGNSINARWHSQSIVDGGVYAATLNLGWDVNVSGPLSADSVTARDAFSTYYHYTSFQGSIYVPQLSVGVSASKPGGGSWSNSSSDIRTKKNVHGFEDGLDVVNALRPVWYTYNGLGGTPENQTFVGFIAQEVKPIAPYMVKTRMAKLHPNDANDTELLTIDESAMSFINLNAIKELNAKLEAQQKTIDAQQRDIQELKTLLKEVMDR